MGLRKKGDVTANKAARGGDAEGGFSGVGVMKGEEVELIESAEKVGGEGAIEVEA